MKTVDLNCDLGESFGNYKCGMDEEILPFITSANVACGFHASDPVVMSKTVKNAVKITFASVRIRAFRISSDLVAGKWISHRQRSPQSHSTRSVP